MTNIELHEFTRSLKQSMGPHDSYIITAGTLIQLLEELSALREKAARPIPNPSILAMVEEHLAGSNIGTKLRFEVEHDPMQIQGNPVLSIRATRNFADGSPAHDESHIVLGDLQRISRERAEEFVSGAVARCVARVHGVGR